MNATQSVDWVPALAVLAVGLLTATLFTLRLFAVSRRAAQAGRGVPLQVRDLAGKRDAFIRQLREMEDTAGKRTPEQLARERYALELETARVLLALEEQAASEDVRRSPRRVASRSGGAAQARPARAGLRAFLWITGSAITLLLLGSFVYQSAKPRTPGGSLTGEVPMEGRTAGGSATVDAEEARAAVARNPQSLDARLELVRAYADGQDWMHVWNEAARVLEQSPAHPEGLAYQAIVRLVMGQSDVAVNTLTKVVDADPDLAVAYAYLVIGQLKMGRVLDAQATAARGSKRFPDHAEDFQQLLVTSWDAKGSARPPARGGGRRVAGTVDIEPSLKGTVAPVGVLFVFAREAGAAGGPPLAVKRLPAIFPAAFELTDADSMMGQPLPDRLLIEARLDSDGDPTTRSPADPKARLEGVKSGRTDLLLILRR
jgi:tetratricopeptide (TPR) repeat protein